MTTSIKVEDSTKSRIDQIRAQLFLSTGQKITQQQLIGLLADWGSNNLEIIKDILLDNPIVLSQEEIDAYKKHRRTTGVKTSPEDIDSVLYGN